MLEYMLDWAFKGRKSGNWFKLSSNGHAGESNREDEAIT